MQTTQYGLPVQRVMELRKQGITNNQIIQILQQEKYGLDDIFSAMSLADTKEGVKMNTGGRDLPPPLPPEQGFQDGRETISDDERYAQQYGAEAAGQEQESAEKGYSQSQTAERIEELAEAIIDEKWNEIVRSINKIIDWKDRTESKITKLEQEMKDLKNQFETLHKGVLGKIGEYDKNLTTIGSDIKAMEKVFGEVLPVMTENVNELSRITKDLKKK